MTVEKVPLALEQWEGGVRVDPRLLHEALTMVYLGRNRAATAGERKEGQECPYNPLIEP